MANGGDAPRSWEQVVVVPGSWFCSILAPPPPRPPEPNWLLATRSVISMQARGSHRLPVCRLPMSFLFPTLFLSRAFPLPWARRYYLHQPLVRRQISARHSPLSRAHTCRASSGQLDRTVARANRPAQRHHEGYYRRRCGHYGLHRAWMLGRLAYGMLVRPGDFLMFFGIPTEGHQPYGLFRHVR